MQNENILKGNNKGWSSEWEYPGNILGKISIVFQ